MSNGNGEIAGAIPTRLKAPAIPKGGRVPPYSLEAEKGILGSIMVDPSVMSECGEKIAPEQFFIPANQTIYGVMVDCFEKKKPLDLISFTQELRDRNVLEEVGGAGYLTDLATFVPADAALDYYIDIVHDKFILRELINACTKAINRAYEEQDNVRELIDQVQAKITSLALDRLMESPMVHIAKDVDVVMEEIYEAHKHRGRTIGLATGIIDLDKMTSGLNPGDLWVIAARPSMGKTALAMTIAEYVALSRREGPCRCPERRSGKHLADCEGGKWKYQGQPVVIYSLETSRRRLVRRLLSDNASVDLQKIRDGHLAEEDFERLEEVRPRLKQAPIYIDHTANMRLFEFKARARWAAVKLGVKLIVIDYMQLMKSGSKRAEFSRVLELTEVSAAIKEIGRTLEIPIIAVVALNRETEKLESGRPKMSHLRECGAVEYDADVIGLLYRQEYYMAGETEEEKAKKKELEDHAELIIAKHKDGPVGSIYLTWTKQYTRFQGRTKEDYYGERQPF